MNEDIYIERDMIKEIVKTSFKASKNQFNHILKCEKCLQKYIDIVQCTSIDLKKKGAKKK